MILSKSWKGWLAEVVVRIYYRLSGYTILSCKNEFAQIDIECVKDTKYIVGEIKYVADFNKMNYLSYKQFYGQYLYLQKLSKEQLNLEYHLILVNSFFYIQRIVKIRFKLQGAYNMYILLHLNKNN